VNSISKERRARGCLLGLAAGDAVGTTVEFSPRGSFDLLADMVGGGPFSLNAGEWTDDTSMALCLADSLIACQGFDAADQMRRYVRWLREGYRSSTGRCFDVGTTVHRALAKFEQTGDPFSGPTDPRSAGNGSIMRLAPVVLYFMPDRQDVAHYAAESSRTTHGAAEAVNACRLFATILAELLAGAAKEDAVGVVEPDESLGDGLRAIAAGHYRTKSESGIQGTGYVVESLEAALWSFWNAESFEEAILLAANLGDDADTTAAVCGQLAGAYWGEEGIPRRWIERLAMVDEIRSTADLLWEAT
jgi:ADP-ribosyl-[dinitrogen reductase] hydrolase